MVVMAWNDKYPSANLTTLNAQCIPNKQEYLGELL